MPEMRPRPVESSTGGAAFEAIALFVDIDWNTAFRSRFGHRFQRCVANQTAGHPFRRIGFQRKRLQNLAELQAGAVGFHNDDTPARGQTQASPFPGQDNPPLSGGFPDKISIRNPPLINGIETENAKPLGQCSKIAVGGKTDIHISHKTERIAA
jgi:hypothetical protein